MIRNRRRELLPAVKKLCGLPMRFAAGDEESAACCEARDYMSSAAVSVDEI